MNFKKTKKKNIFPPIYRLLIVKTNQCKTKDKKCNHKPSVRI